MIDVVCGVIGDGEGRVLACLRPVGRHLAGKWEFPGGKVELNESPEGALVRELQEELGVKVAVGCALSPVVFEYDEATIRLLPYHCVIVDGELQALEHEKLQWCSRADFSGLSWADADLPILREIFYSQDGTNGCLTW